MKAAAVKAAAGSTSKRKGGATMMVWMVFANLFEPKKVAAMEQIDTQRRIGTEAQRANPTAPPD